MTEQKEDDQHAETQEQKQPQRPNPNPRKRPFPSSTSTSATLLRPFKSPLIRPPPPPTTTTTTTQSTSTNNNKPTTTATAAPLTKLIDNVNATSLNDLQKQHAALHARLLSLRSELDTAQQALRIERSGRDEELRGLIEKWRRISQDVAEELFPYARDRVERMGGVRVWRRKEKERLKRVREEWVDDDEGGLDPDTDRDEKGGGEEEEEEDEENGEDEVSVLMGVVTVAGWMG